MSNEYLNKTEEQQFEDAKIGLKRTGHRFWWRLF